MLHYPDMALVRHAVERANLTDEEWQAVDLRENKGCTIESTAEKMYLSVRTVNRRYQSAMHKFDECWDGLKWVSAVTDIKQ